MVTVLGLDVAASTMQLGGLIALRWLGYLSAESTFVVMGLACAVSGGTTFFLMRRRFAPNRGNAMADLRRNWSFGKWAFGSQLATLASGYGMPWMLAIFLGTAATGRYSACLSIVMIANPLLIGLNNFLSPQAIHAYHTHGLSGLRRFTWGISVWVTGTLTVLTVLLVFFGARLLTLLYGQKLVGNELPVALLALNTLGGCGGPGRGKRIDRPESPGVEFLGVLQRLDDDDRRRVFLDRALRRGRGGGGVPDGHHHVDLLADRAVYRGLPPTCRKGAVIDANVDRCSFDSSVPRWPLGRDADRASKRAAANCAGGSRGGNIVVRGRSRLVDFAI